MSEIMIVPIPARAGVYSVSTGGGTYQCDANAGTCTCPAFIYRYAEKHESCKHLRALAEKLEEERACPLCHGYGKIALRNRYAGEAPDCVLCSGSGLKQPGLSQDDLREIFK